jgi:hypothetical protein
LRTNWSAEARISSSVAGGSKLASVLMFRHIVVLRRGSRPSLAAAWRSYGWEIPRTRRGRRPPGPRPLRSSLTHGNCAQKPVGAPVPEVGYGSARQ